VCVFACYIWSLLRTITVDICATCILNCKVLKCFVEHYNNGLLPGSTKDNVPLLYPTPPSPYPKSLRLKIGKKIFSHVIDCNAIHEAFTDVWQPARSVKFVVVDYIQPPNVAHISMEKIDQYTYTHPFPFDWTNIEEKRVCIFRERIVS
jgi:hypothetical protein